MADFIPAYSKVKKWEGGFVDNPNDKGLMTYAGITRRFNPDWPGWNFIFNKLDYGPIKTNTVFPELSNMVTEFYKNLWDSNRYGLIKNQSIANLLFDFGVNSGQKTAIKSIQNLVGANTDGVLGLNTAAKINATDSTVLFNKLKNYRTQFYNSILERDPTQSVFAKGWFNRLNDYKYEGGLSIFILLGLVGIFYLIFNR